MPPGDDAVLAAVGDAFEDRYLPPIGRRLVGGNALNVAVQLAGLGDRSTFLGAVGDDDAGRRVRKALAKAGVDTSGLITVAGSTARCDIGVDADGERSFLDEDYGVSTAYAPRAPEIAGLAAVRHVHIGWLADPAGLVSALCGSEATLSQDTGVGATAAGLDVAFGSAGPSPGAARAMLARLLAAGRIAVVTRGVMGAIASAGGDVVEVGIRPVEVVDTTGAGDAFIAGFLHAFVRGRALADCLVAGRDAAAIACTHLGGFPQEGAPLAESPD